VRECDIAMVRSRVVTKHQRSQRETPWRVSDIVQIKRRIFTATHDNLECPGMWNKCTESEGKTYKNTTTLITDL
jgi:hypothetical protein